MQIVVVGPGALGCLLTSILLKGDSTDSISLLDHHENRASQISKNGLFYKLGSDTTNYPVKAFSDPRQFGKVDAVFICVKSYDVEETLRFCAPLLTEDTLLIFMQNGMAHLQYTTSSGKAVPLYGTTTEGATCLGPGHVRHAGTGITYLGFLQPQQNSCTLLLQKLVGRLSAGGMETRSSNSIYSRLWAKLFINVGINALTAIYDCKNGDLLTIPEARDYMAQAIAEAKKVALAEGVTTSDPLERTIQVCRSTAENISSMLQDVHKKRTTEIDAINGAILQMAAKHGIATPVNSFLVDQVKKIGRNS